MQTSTSDTPERRAHHNPHECGDLIKLLVVFGLCFFTLGALIYIEKGWF